MIRVRPILFNTDMVRAILDGRKTTTRRIVKSPYFVDDSGVVPLGMRTAPRGGKLERQIGAMPYPDNPYRINDILYVKETWCFNPKLKEFYYKANRKKEAKAPYALKWRPSIHMPKEAARIWLKVTDVRVERLQDMNLDDFLSEGVIIRPEAFNDPENAYMQARREFAKIWDSTIRKSQTDLNPWVWVIEFERSEKPEEGQA